MEEIVNLIAQYGFSVVLIAWMIFKDYKFNENILGVLEKIQVILGKLETYHGKEANEE